MLPTGRISGLLQPVFSLRSAHDVGVGDFEAFDALFKWMRQASQKLLMVLPLLPTTPGDPSPYSTRSAFGLNPLFIHLGWLPEGVRFTPEEQRMLDEARASATVRYDLVFPVKTAALGRAFHSFEKAGSSARSREFEAWCLSQCDWLDGYALYSALSEHFAQKPWWEWPDGLATREPKALEAARREHLSRIRYHQWLQWVAHEQWQRVRASAKSHGIVLCGDEPFIISQDSADCWCFPQYLRRDARLGVPPDDFSADGQDWGLPWFDFEALAKDGDAWLRRRAKHAAATYDLRRIDHAIGYFRQYIRDEQTPRGRFVPDQEPAQRARGEKNFRLLSDGAGIVAEDLGVIPRFARDVLAMLGLPGYQVMRWSREDGVYRDPRHYPEVSLVTTGTHDTETMRQWWEGAPDWERETVCRTWPELHGFQHAPPKTWSFELHEALLRAALNAQSMLCVLPWQDVFGETERTNTPGTVGPHNWAYRMRPEVQQLATDESLQRTAHWLTRLANETRRG
ncbi:MAG: 4-alpha-glucanotransferase [Myxococcota bacterium]